MKSQNIHVLHSTRKPIQIFWKVRTARVLLCPRYLHNPLIYELLTSITQNFPTDHISLQTLSKITNFISLPSLRNRRFHFDPSVWRKVSVVIEQKKTLFWQSSSLLLRCLRYILFLKSSRQRRLLGAYKQTLQYIIFRKPSNKLFQINVYKISSDKMLSLFSMTLWNFWEKLSYSNIIFQLKLYEYRCFEEKNHYLHIMIVINCSLIFTCIYIGKDW